MSLGAHFERSVRGVFGFLVREHSFAEPQVSRRGYQFTVLEYVKGSVAIQANFDMEERSWSPLRLAMDNMTQRIRLKRGSGLPSTRSPSIETRHG